MNIRRVFEAMAAAIAIAGIIVVVSAEGRRDQSAGSAAGRDQITVLVGRWELPGRLTHDRGTDRARTPIATGSAEQTSTPSLYAPVQPRCCRIGCAGTPNSVWAVMAQRRGVSHR